jgi:hypothetical protein
MSKSLELSDSVYAALNEAARASATTPAKWIAAKLLHPEGNDKSLRDDDWIDHDFLRTCAQGADESVSLETVRAALAKIPGRLVDDIRSERDER